MAEHKLTAHSYEQQLVDQDEWLAEGRPAATLPTKTYREGEVVEFRSDEERDRLLELGAVEEVEEGTAPEDMEAEIEERRKELGEQPAGEDDRTLEDLQSEAGARGLPKSGTKAELRERLASSPDS